MIVLLQSSTTCWGINQQLFYGGADSVTISYDDLRIVNAKLIELKYEKELNIKYKQIIDNDSVLINTIMEENINLVEQNVKLKRKNTIPIISGITIIINTIIMLLK